MKIIVNSNGLIFLSIFFLAGQLHCMENNRHIVYSLKELNGMIDRNHMHAFEDALSVYKNGPVSINDKHRGIQLINYAIHQKSIKALELLLQAGANPNVDQGSYYSTTPKNRIIDRFEQSVQNNNNNERILFARMARLMYGYLDKNPSPMLLIMAEFYFPYEPRLREILFNDLLDIKGMP